MTVIQTPMGITWPQEWSVPYIDEIGLTQLDVDRIKEDSDLTMFGGGITVLAGNLFSWSAPIYVYSPRNGTFITIAAGSVSVTDGHSIWITPSTRPIPTETLTVSSGASVPVGAVWIGTRSGSTVSLRSAGAFGALWKNDGGIIKPLDPSHTVSIESSDTAAPGLHVESAGTTPGALSVLVDSGAGYGVNINNKGTGNALVVRDDGVGFLFAGEAGGTTVKHKPADGDLFAVTVDASGSELKIERSGTSLQVVGTNLDSVALGVQNDFTLDAAGSIDIDAVTYINIDAASGGAIRMGNASSTAGIYIGGKGSRPSINIGSASVISSFRRAQTVSLEGMIATTISMTDSSATDRLLYINANNGGTGAGNILIRAGDEISFDARGMVTPITVNQAGALDLVGFTATSIIGCFNEIKSAMGGGPVTSVSAGDGLDFTTITTTGSVILGTPGTLTSTTTDGVTATSHTHAITTGISDENILRVDHSGAADNDYAKFTANGIEGRSYAEVKTDLSLNNVENTTLSTWGGSANVTAVGTIGTGTWNATTISISKGGTGQTTAQAAIDALTQVSGATNEYVLTKDTASGNAIWKSGGGSSFSDSAFSVYDDVDNTKVITFQASGIDTGTTRVYAFPDEDGTIALETTITLDQAYSNSGGASSIAVDAGSVTWTMASANSFVVNVDSAGTSNGFEVTRGNDNFYLRPGASADQMICSAALYTMDLITSATFTIGRSTSSVSGYLRHTTGDLELVSGGDSGGDLRIQNAKSTQDIFFSARSSGDIPFNETGNITLSGFTATSVIGAFNELKGADHTRLHSMTNVLDHSATNHRTFYSNGSGQVVELAHGTSGHVLTSNGASAAPSWQAKGNGYSYGSQTTTQIKALTGMVAGETVFNSTVGKPFYYTGNSWQCDGETIELINKDGSAVSEGEVVKYDNSNNLGCYRVAVAGAEFMAGVVAIGGANNAYIAVATSGIWDVEMNGTTQRSYYIESSSTLGKARDVSTSTAYVFGITLEYSATAGLVKCTIGREDY
jgi:hypothetical protein